MLCGWSEDLLLLHEGECVVDKMRAGAKERRGFSRALDRAWDVQGLPWESWFPFMRSSSIFCIDRGQMAAT